jgi:hypothetical protein
LLLFFESLTSSSVLLLSTKNFSFPVSNSSILRDFSSSTLNFYFSALKLLILSPLLTKPLASCAYVFSGGECYLCYNCLRFYLFSWIFSCLYSSSLFLGSSLLVLWMLEGTNDYLERSSSKLGLCS